jgi:hypothetical protein
MCNHREERDVGLMLMSLSKIPRDLLDRMERDYEQELDQSTNKWVTGFQKRQYIALKVIQTIKRVHAELDAKRGR